MALHAGVIAAVLMGTFWFITPPIPRDRMMMAFIASPPPPPPPPPPPAPSKAVEKQEQPVPTSGSAAPIAEPSAIVPEAPAAGVGEEDFVGVPGGVSGGIAGGVLGGLMPEAPPAPPPPPPPAPRQPLRVGGQIREPALVYRVEPQYPALAVASKMEGLVILEAIVDQEGRVESVRSLRTRSIFDDSAIKAVRQWRYSPVLLNGKPEKFILTVVVSFSLVN